jgi:hypothetical protein
LAKWKNCQPKNGSSSQVKLAGENNAAASAPDSTRAAGTHQNRSGLLNAYERTSPSVYNHPVDATCTDEPTNSTQASPWPGAAEVGGASATATANAPPVSTTVSHSHARAGTLSLRRSRRRRWPTAR